MSFYTLITWIENVKKVIILPPDVSLIIGAHFFPDLHLIDYVTTKTLTCKLFLFGEIGKMFLRETSVKKIFILT